MNRYGVRLVVSVLALATLVAVGAYTYNLGVARGLMETGRAVEGAGAGVPVVHVWHPWGFGFFPFFPLFFILFWVFVLRGLFWRGPWRRPSARFARSGLAFRLGATASERSEARKKRPVLSEQTSRSDLC